jgi:hypothetical protein
MRVLKRFPNQQLSPNGDRMFTSKRCLAAVILPIVLISLQGCTYNGQIKERALVNSSVVGQKSSVGITLIDSKDGISNPKFSVGAFTFNYDLKDSYFDGAKEALNSLYSKVDVANTPTPSNPYYAVPYFDFRQTRSSGLSAGLEIRSRIDLFDTDTKQLIKSFTSQKEVDYNVPGSAQALGALTGLTLFVILPVTMPVALNIDGNHGKDLIEASIKESFGSLKTELASSARILANKSSVEDCFARLAHDSSLSAISDKVALDGVNAQTFGMLANTSKPTAAEKEAIQRYADESSKCFDDAERLRVNVGTPPSLNALYNATKTARTNLLVLLYNGAINYGEFARKRQEVSDAFDMAYAQITTELAKQSAEANARAEQLAIEAQRNNIAEIQARAAETQTRLMGIQMLTPRTTTTTCTPGIGDIRCTTR